MSLKVNVGVSRKVTENFNSTGYSLTWKARSTPRWKTPMASSSG